MGIFAVIRARRALLQGAAILGAAAAMAISLRGSPAAVDGAWADSFGMGALLASPGWLTLELVSGEGELFRNGRAIGALGRRSLRLSVAPGDHLAVAAAPGARVALVAAGGGVAIPAPGIFLVPPDGRLLLRVLPARG